MTNRERYRHTFGALHASPDTVLEVTKMKQNKRRVLRPLTGLAAALAAMALLVGSAFAVNEVTDGALAERIQSIRVWFNGEETEITLVSTGEGTYDVVSDGGAIATVTEDEDSVEFNVDSDEDEGRIAMEWDGGSIEMEWSGTGGGSAGAGFGTGAGDEETVTVTEGVSETDPEASEDSE
ncbi:MAG: hypothetical protein LUE61_11065 [Clostridiales bacterium]|nr:hypothetical protein [Clostridiales bacterium]